MSGFGVNGSRIWDVDFRLQACGFGGFSFGVYGLVVAWPVGVGSQKENKQCVTKRLFQCTLALYVTQNPKLETLNLGPKPKHFLCYRTQV